MVKNIILAVLLLFAAVSHPILFLILSSLGFGAFMYHTLEVGEAILQEKPVKIKFDTVAVFATIAWPICFIAPRELKAGLKYKFNKSFPNKKLVFRWPPVSIEDVTEQTK